MFQADEKVYRVAPFAVPEAHGGWPCGFCGDLFPVQQSWRVTLARSGTVIACEGCAQDARRHRAGGGRRGTTASGGRDDAWSRILHRVSSSQPQDHDSRR